MKKIILTIVVILTGLTKLGMAQEPKLPLVEAAVLADAFLKENLKEDKYYLRSITLIRSSREGKYFKVTYTPPISRAAIEDNSKPIKSKYIKVTMDGKVSFEERESSGERRIIRRQRRVIGSE